MRSLAPSSYFSLFRESLDDLGRDMQEEDGCDEGDGENDDDVRVTIRGRALQRVIRKSYGKPQASLSVSTQATGTAAAAGG